CFFLAFRQSRAFLDEESAELLLGLLGAHLRGEAFPERESEGPFQIETLEILFERPDVVRDSVPSLVDTFQDRAGFRDSVLEVLGGERRIAGVCHDSTP